MQPSDQRSTPTQRWLARAAFAAWIAAIVVLVGTEGAIGLTLLVVGLLGAIAVLVGGYWFLAKRGLGRWLGLTVAVTAVVVVLVIFLWQDALVIAIVVVVLFVLAGAAARRAMRGRTPEWMPTVRTPPPSRVFIVMNPRSGGGKVVKFDLQRKAEELGAEVVLLDGPGHVDVAAIVRDAVDRGADLLGVAGGDGTQALVAGICVEYDIPLLVISAGTRNHFALDLGLDRDDPSTCLAALTDGEEVRVDLGLIGDRPFVNNASFGAYAEIVQSPEYRDNKNRTILAMLPDLLSEEGSKLSVRTGDRTLTDLQAVLVSNNPYGSGRLRDLGRRERIDAGTLGVIAGRIASAAEAAALLRRAQFRTVTTLVAEGDVVIDGQPVLGGDGSATEVPVGIDGEALTVPTPVRCSIRPKALRVRLPRDRPGVPLAPDPVDWKRLTQLALGR